MGRTYFISDVHLGIDKQHSPQRERERESQLLSFLRHIAADAERLIIAGDLFDFWFEYHDVIPRGSLRILTQLQELALGGVEIRYLAGNHDFWIGNFFPDELGVQVEKKSFTLNLNGKKFYIGHGDGLAKNDFGYLILRAILRNRFSTALFSLLHPRMAFSIARRVSRTSRYYTDSKDYGERDGMVEFAEEKIKDGFDYVLLGHRHFPECRSIGDGVYVNLGDWMTHFTYAVFDGTTLQLCAWNGGK